MKLKLCLFLFLLFTFLFWFCRLWHFEKLLTFHSDQGIFFSETWQMVQDQKPRLLGLKVGTKEVLGRAFFTGPFFYYVLAILGVVFSWDPKMITLVFLFFWWFTALGIWFLVKKLFGEIAAVLSYGLFASLPFLVFYSRIVWNTGLLPLISVFFFLSLHQLLKKPKLKNWLLTGLFLGLGINLNYAALVWLPFFVLFFIFYYKRKNWSLKFPIFVSIGFLIGELPLLLFELRHSFYNTQTFFFFFKHGVLEGRNKGPVTDYHFVFAFLPLFFILIAKGVNLIEKNFGKRKTIFLFLVLISVLTFSVNWRQEWGTGMPPGWTLEKEKEVALLICKDIGPKNFEVAETIGADTRAYDLRFFLTFYGCPPLGVENYQEADILYLIAPQARPVKEEKVWEVESLRPFEVFFKKDVNDGIFLYKLVRISV